jgi:hypothetical protein
MGNITPTQLRLLEQIADPRCATFISPEDSEMAGLKEQGLVESVIAQQMTWNITDAGLKTLERYRAIGICAECRTLQRRFDGTSVVCEMGHIDKPSRTPCSVCDELDTRGLKPVCSQGVEIDPPPATKCKHWRFRGHEAARRSSVAIWEA